MLFFEWDSGFLSHDYFDMIKYRLVRIRLTIPSLNLEVFLMRLMLPIPWLYLEVFLMGLMLPIPWQWYELCAWDWTHQSHGIQTLKPPCAVGRNVQTVEEEERDVEGNPEMKGEHESYICWRAFREMIKSITNESWSVQYCLCWSAVTSWPWSSLTLLSIAVVLIAPTQPQFHHKICSRLWQRRKLFNFLTNVAS